MARKFTFRLDSEGVDTLRRELEQLGQQGVNAFRVVEQASPQLANALSRAEKQAEAAARKLEEVNRTARSRDLAAYGQQLDGLRTKYVPLFAAQERYRAQLAELRTGLHTAALSQAEYDAALSRTKASFAAQVQSIRGVMPALGQQTLQVRAAASAVGAATPIYRNFGHVAQQAGFQVGDLAVQIASGQGVIRPFIQQGTQMLQFFGPWGSIIGAAGAVVGALAIGLFGLGDATDEATAAQEKHNDLMARAKRVTDDLVGSTYDLAAARRAERDIAISQARAETLRLETELQGQLAALPDVEAHLRLGQAEGRIGADVDVAAAAAASIAADPRVVAIKEQLRQLRQTRADLGEFGDQISRGTVPGSGGVSEDTRRARKDLLASLRGEIDLLGKVGLERQIAANLAKAQVAADSDLGKTIALLTTKVHEAEQAETSRTEAGKDAERLAKERLARMVDARAELDKQLDAEQASRDSLRAIVDGLKAEQAQLGLSERARFIRTELLKAEKAITEATIDDAAAYRREIELQAGALYDATEAEKARAKATTDAARERDRQATEIARQAAENMRRPFVQAAEGIQDAFRDAFASILNGGVDSAEEFGDRLVTITKTAAAEIAAALVFQPVMSTERSTLADINLF